MTTPPSRAPRSFASTALEVCGWCVAHTPEVLWRATSAVLGDALALLLARRRRISLSNLSHAFPEKPPAWCRALARESSRRLIETGLLSLAAPYWSEDRIRARARLSPRLTAYVAQRGGQPRAAIFATIHVAHWETQVWLPLLLGEIPLGPFGVIFRPLKQPALDAYVKRTRERFGMQLLSRKAGFQGALRMLRDGGFIGLLFDQNAGDEGSLSLFFDRVCSSTELPGLLTVKFNADLWVIYPRRRGFWKVELDAEPVSHDHTQVGATLALNRWLEDALRRDQDFCASWLWAHNRWRTQDRPERRLRLQHKRNVLSEDLAARGLAQLPRRTRFFIRLPNWLGDVVMALPLLQALRTSRPDAELTLIGKAAFAPLLVAEGLADHYEPLPPRGSGYFAHFRALRHRYPDTYLLFTQSFRADLEAWLTGCRQRFGLVRRGRRRFALTHAYTPPPDFQESAHHQLELYEAWLRHFGLEGPLPRQPHARARPAADAPIGLIAGSENNPEKRWPVAHWQALIAAFPTQRFVLFGTAKDRAITTAVAASAGARVEDLAGRTDLPTYMTRLRECAFLVTNDTGGMHLANALGVPLIALFGPTNPVRTGPVFAAPCRLLQPRGCPPTGGASLDQLPPEDVVGAVRTWLAQPPEKRGIEPDEAIRNPPSRV